MGYDKYLYDILCKIAVEKNLEIKGLSDDYIIEIKRQSEKNEKIYIFGNAFPLNNNVAQKICSDKSALSEILNINKIPCVPHLLYCYLDYNIYWNLETLKQQLQLYKSHLVVKDNNGSCGKNVFLVKNEKEIKKAVNLLVKNKLDIAVSPYIEDAKEYRIIMLDGECQVCYLKEKPFVVGDGISKLEKLISNKYKKFHFELPKCMLKTKPASGEQVYIGWKNNLKLNAMAKIITDQTFLKKALPLCKKIVKILNIRFCSIDLFETKDNLQVLEINSIVYMGCFSNFTHENFELTKKIFTLALEKSFESKTQYI